MNFLGLSTLAIHSSSCFFFKVIIIINRSQVFLSHLFTKTFRKNIYKPIKTQKFLMCQYSDETILHFLSFFHEVLPNTLLSVSTWYFYFKFVVQLLEVEIEQFLSKCTRKEKLYSG